jgi:hypothetical protein
MTHTDLLSLAQEVYAQKAEEEESIHKAAALMLCRTENAQSATLGRRTYTETGTLMLEVVLMKWGPVEGDRAALMQMNVWMLHTGWSGTDAVLTVIPCPPL